MDGRGRHGRQSAVTPFKLLSSENDIQGAMVRVFVELRRLKMVTTVELSRCCLVSVES